jgi:hypothetical protein
MKGLLLDSFYKTIVGMKLLLCVLAIISAIIIGFVQNQTIVQAYVFIIVVSVAAFSLSSVRKDADSRWNQYEMTLPLKRKTIVRCKYVSFLLWVMIAVILTIAFIGIVVNTKGIQSFDFGMRDILTLLSVAGALAIQMGSFYFIGLYALGFEKSDVLVILSLILAIGVNLLLVGFLNSKNVSIEAGREILLLVAAALFILSYNMANVLYGRNEY